MSSVSAENTSIRNVVPARELCVVNWPLRDDPARTVAVAVACAAVGAFAGILSASVSMGMLSAAALAVALWKLWIPVRCELGPAGITLTALRRCRHMPWRQVGAVQSGPRGVLIRGSGAAAWPGVYLPWRHHAHLVVEFHEHYCGAARETVRSPDISLR